MDEGASGRGAGARHGRLKSAWPREHFKRLSYESASRSRYGGEGPPSLESAMQKAKTSSGQVPHSSGRNQFATAKTLTILVIAVVLAMLFLWAPW